MLLRAGPLAAVDTRREGAYVNDMGERRTMMADIRLPELVHYDGPGGLPRDPALKAAWEKHHKAVRRKARRARQGAALEDPKAAAGVCAVLLGIVAYLHPGMGVLYLAGFLTLAIGGWALWEWVRTK